MGESTRPPLMADGYILRVAVLDSCGLTGFQFSAAFITVEHRQDRLNLWLY